MIGNITRGASFAGLGRYLYATGKNHEAHVDPRVVASENVMRDDSRTWRPWVADMEWCAQQRPEVAEPVWHCSVRAAPEDRVMGDEEWGRIAAGHVERMGLAEHPWVAVRHADDHVHIVASRVNGDGKLWRDSFDKRRNMDSLRVLEERHGLTRLAADRETSRLAAVTKSERERGKRLGVDPERARLRDAMHDARKAAKGRGAAGWEDELARRGVQFRASTSRDGIKVNGYSVTLPGWRDQAGEQVWLKSSDVDRKLSWPRVSKELGSDRSRDAGAIEAARRVASAYPSRPQARPQAEKPAAEQAAERLGRIRRQQDRQQDRDRGMGR